MNKVERVKAVFRGEKPDKVPAGFWFHYPYEMPAKEMAEEHLKLFRYTDMDVMKIMQDFNYTVNLQIQTPEDWYRLKLDGTNSAVFRKQAEVIKRIVDGIGGEALVFQTVYNPFATTEAATNREMLMDHAKNAPDALAAGVSQLAEVLEEWVNAYLDLGVDGIYFSAQYGEVGRFNEEEWNKLARPYDLKIMQAVANRGKYNFLHICGLPKYQFKADLPRFADYPGEIVNWSVKDTGVTLKEGQKLFKRPVMGGLNNKGNILSGDDASIIGEVNQTIRSFGSTSMMIGADCTIQGQGISLDRIRTAVKAAHDYVE